MQNTEEDILYLYLELDKKTGLAKNIAVSASELARNCGVKPSTVRNSINRYEKGFVLNSKYVRISVEKEGLLDNYNEQLNEDNQINKILGLF